MNTFEPGTRPVMTFRNVLLIRVEHFWLPDFYINPILCRYFTSEVTELDRTENSAKKSRFFMSSDWSSLSVNDNDRNDAASTFFDGIELKWLPVDIDKFDAQKLFVHEDEKNETVTYLV